MCNCINIEMGTYKNSILLGYYPVMQQYKMNRIAAGLSGDGIMVDRCIIEQVIELWEAGVRTYGSCCGHNTVQGMINVDPDDFEKALSLGYELYIFDNDPLRKDTVKTKTGNSNE